ncbi:hypothetical protein DRQ19_00620 [bacterium]|nr:MAG: hypothetical protein DRQ19_00620 [bacterium]
MKREEKIVGKLASFLPETVASAIISNPDDFYILGERREVTVLFADITGFVSISEKSDPEELFILINTYFKRFIDAIKRYDGTIDKFLGDALLVLFGASRAHPDDPMRAVICASEILKAVEDVNSHPPKLHFRLPRISVSIGIATGKVVSGLVGDDTHREYTVIGDTVNLASRLETLASPGEILVSEETFIATNDNILYESLPPQKIRGKRKKQRVYRFISERMEKEELATDVPFGLKKTETEIIETIEKGVPVAILGETGTGKSLLVRGIKDKLLRSGYSPILVETPSWGKNLYLFLAGKILPKKGIRSLAGVKKNLLPLLNPLILTSFPGEENFESILPEERERLTFEIIDEIFRRLARRNRSALIVENSSNLDRASTILLRRISKTPCPILITATEKTAPVERCATFRLRNFSLSKTKSFIRYILCVPRVGKRLADFVHKETHGNPGHIKEMLSFLIDKGVLRISGGKAELQSVPDDLPDGMAGLVISRVDRLDPGSRAVLKSAAVAGEQFTRPVIRFLSREKGCSFYLTKLEKSGLIRRINGGFAFTTNTIKEAVYSSILESQRIVAHRMVAAFLEANDRDKLEAIAFQYNAGKNYQKAFSFFYLAGKKYSSISATREALYYYENAYQAWRKTKGKEKDGIELLLSMSKMHWILGELEEMLHLGELALALAKRCGMQESIANALSAIGLAYDEMGKFEQATLCHRKAEDIYRQLQQFPRIIDALNNLGITALDAGNTVLAEKKFTEALKLAQERKLIEASLADVYASLGYLLFSRGKLSEAVEYYKKAEKIDEQFGNIRGQAINGINIANILMEKGEYSSEEEYLTRALDIFTKINDIRGMLLAMNNLGELKRVTGDINSAWKLHRRAKRLALAHNDPEALTDALRNMGLDKLDIGDTRNARRYIYRSLTLARENIDKSGELEAEIARLSYIVKVGRGNRGSCLRRIEQLSAETGNRFAVERARAILQEAPV